VRCLGPSDGPRGGGAFSYQRDTHVFSILQVGIGRLTSFSLDLLSSAVDLSAVCQPKETIIGSRFRSNSYNSTLGLRVRTKKKENEKLKEFEGRLPESQGQNLALTS